LNLSNNKRAPVAAQQQQQHQEQQQQQQVWEGQELDSTAATAVRRDSISGSTRFTSVRTTLSESISGQGTHL
jgi:hypothetical protein